MNERDRIRTVAILAAVWKLLPSNRLEEVRVSIYLLQ